MLYRLTKSKFILGLQCDKALYLDVYKPKLAYYSPETLNRFRKGRNFESKIKSHFSNGIDVSMALGKKIDKYPEFTSNLLKKNEEITLFEAGFVFNEVLVLADIVHKDIEGNIFIYEIKNSLSVKEVFCHDIYLQHYVIAGSLMSLFQDSPLTLKSFSIIYNDGKEEGVYREMLQDAKKAEETVSMNVEHFKKVLQGMEPNIATGNHCLTPYTCPFMQYCEGRKNVQLELPKL